MACVDLPGFPLQLLLRRHPDWRDRAVVVVDTDRPQGRVQWVNERARALRVLPGMRYAAALSLAADLRAGVVPGSEIANAVALLSERLRRFTPRVEPSKEEPGVFWLDARGLERLYASLPEWAQKIRADLGREHLDATVVVGFHRFGTYALARAKRGVLVLAGADDERAAAREVPLDRLELPPTARDTLTTLGISTVGQFAGLPSEGIDTRFGPEVHRLHRLAAGELLVPLQPERSDPPPMRRLALDYAERDAGRLIEAIERLLRPLLDEVAAKGRALSELKIGFRFERLGDHLESLRPASPTLDDRLLVELIRLRLEAVRKLPDAVNEIVLLAQATEATPRQLHLFATQARRDPEAANRALARVRAHLGDATVVRARLRDGHLPEGRFTWEPLDGIAEAVPRTGEAGRLVRRIQTRPIPLPPRERHEPDGWMLRGLEHGPVFRVMGPYIVSGGWWRHPVHREYHFAETQRGELLWVYYDRPRRRWFLHGRIE
jgi:protein ImuB